MPKELFETLNPFLTTGIATFALLYYFLDQKHKLKTEQILVFWFLAGAIFFFVPFIPKSLSFPFVYFFIQAVLVYLLLRNYWKVSKKEVFRLTAIFILVNIVSILALSYIFKGVI